MAEFKNPNQSGSGGGTDNRSLLVMMVVMVGVIVGLQYYRAKHNPEVAPSTTTSAPSQPVAAAPLGSVQSATAAPGTPTSVATVQAVAEQQTVVENELYRITFSNRGAQATSWVLKKYKDNAGRPLDLVNEAAAKQFGYPLSLYTYDKGMTAGLAQALYVPSATGTLQAPSTLTFKYSSGNVTVAKTFSFDGTYVLHADTLVTQNGAPVRSLLSWPAGFGDTETPVAYNSVEINTMVDGKASTEALKKVSGGNTLNGPLDWAGLSDGYFATIFLPDHTQSASLVTLHEQLMATTKKNSTGKQEFLPLPPNGAKLPPEYSAYPFLGAGIGDASGHTQTNVFVGPKAVSVLENVKSVSGENLKPLLDFGFFGFIGKYLFLALRAVHAAIAPAAAIALTAKDWSWGWAIILLTVIINLVLLPLRIQSMKSMLKMQRIQPQMDAIKAKFKNPKPTDPKMAEMNQEIMALQKANGVSMFGGCIPTLVQLPLLFAFFTMLSRVVELRQAHWGWLHDLSAADPIHILPFILVITSFLVQFYTPSPGVDPQQQKMMAFMMPAFSGYITWNYASGLALYWVVGNFIMIAQQAIMNRTSLGREIREIALKRAAKKKAVTSTSTGGVRTLQGKR